MLEMMNINVHVWSLHRPIQDQKKMKWKTQNKITKFYIYILEYDKNKIISNNIILYIIYVHRGKFSIKV